MISSLCKGNSVFIFNKDTAQYSKGVVNKITSVQNTNFSNPLQPIQNNIDIIIDANGENLEFKNVPSNLSLVVCGDMIISDNVEDMSNSVSSYLKDINNTLNSIPKLQERASKVESILRDLNPQFRKEKERDEHIKLLEEKITKLQEQISKMNIKVD